MKEVFKVKEEIRELVLGLGANVCGFADIGRFSETPAGFNPKDIFPSCKSVVAFGVALPKGLYSVDPHLVYGHFNDFICSNVDAVALKTAKEIERLFGCLSVPLPCDSPYEYWDAEKLEGRGLLSMKHTAMLAGLGTLGKSTLLLNEDYGNRLTVGAVLTELELTSDPLAESICIQSCRLCLDSCPSGALDGISAVQAKCRPNTYGKNARGFSTVNCNKCRTVCPMRFGRK